MLLFQAGRRIEAAIEEIFALGLARSKGKRQWFLSVLSTTVCIAYLNCDDIKGDLTSWRVSWSSYRVSKFTIFFIESFKEIAKVNGSPLNYRRKWTSSRLRWQNLHTNVCSVSRGSWKKMGERWCEWLLTIKGMNGGIGFLFMIFQVEFKGKPHLVSHVGHLSPDERPFSGLKYI